jgi:acylphosphatase
MLQRLHLIVHGTVQGVFYRASTYDRATHLAVTGFVRNVPNGSVEIVAEGEDERLRELLAWCKIGPTAAEVDNVEIQWLEHRGEFPQFEIRY